MTLASSLPGSTRGGIKLGSLVISKGAYLLWPTPRATLIIPAIAPTGMLSSVSDGFGGKIEGGEGFGVLDVKVADNAAAPPG